MNIMGDGMIAQRRGGCVYFRSRKRQTPPDGPPLIPDSFWTRFGEDTAIVDTSWEPPRITSWSEIGRRKRERQAERLRWKREAWSEVTIRPIYVWVFHCPGISSIYEGWWTYLWGRGWDSGKYLNQDEVRIRQLMELFPLADPTLFGPALSHEQWQIRFAKAFCCRNPDGTPRKHAGRIQGKALLWAEFYNDSFRKIIGRAYLPGRGTS